jgi:hypothetical protein
MSGRSPRFEWLPPFIVGACAAAAAEVAVALLIYTGPGLMRSLTTVLTVEAGAFGIGLWTAPGPRPDLTEALRRRILLCLFAILGATVFSAFWTFLRTVGGTAVGQGLGLAVMAALPLYAFGGVLGTLGSLGSAEQRRHVVGVSASLGGAFGLAATGILLPRLLTPASLLLFCIVLISSAGLVYSSVLERRLSIRVRARRPSAVGEVRIEDRHLPSRDLSARLLFEGNAMRRWVPLTDGSGPTWDVALFRSLSGASESMRRVLLLGGGASPLPALAGREHSSVVVQVLERSGVVTEVAREHLETGLQSNQAGTVGLKVGNLDDLAAGLTGRFDLILVDTASFEAVGGMRGLSLMARRSLFEHLTLHGLVALGPEPPAPGTWSFPDGWATAEYVRESPLEALDLGCGSMEVVLVGAATGDLPTNLADGFERRTGPPT